MDVLPAGVEEEGDERVGVIKGKKHDGKESNGLRSEERGDVAPISTFKTESYPSFFPIDNLLLITLPFLPS